MQSVKLDDRVLGDTLVQVRDLVIADPELRVRIKSKYSWDIEREWSPGKWMPYCTQEVDVASVNYLEWRIRGPWLYLVDAVTAITKSPLRMHSPNIKSIEVYRPEKRFFYAAEHR
jgi:hypothetical protein